MAPTLDQFASGLIAAGHIVGEFSVLVGDCKTGVDRFVTDYFNRESTQVKVFQADWEYYRARGNVKAAGPVRNQKMIDEADALIAFPGPDSKGTHDAIRRAKAKGIPVFITPIGEEA
jgi:hypothetical protein